MTGEGERKRERERERRRERKVVTQGEIQSHTLKCDSKSASTVLDVLVIICVHDNYSYDDDDDTFSIET